MVCDRCITAVQNIFSNLNISTTSVLLGEVLTPLSLSSIQLEELQKSLKAQGFEILQSADERTVELVKNVIIRLINNLDVQEGFVLSKYIANEVGKDYQHLSRLFSIHENSTLEQYFILQKIEKVKELLLYNENSLTEISHQLGYKSVQHLSNQFKNVTGFSPTSFRNQENSQRVPLDQI